MIDSRNCLVEEVLITGLMKELSGTIIKLTRASREENIWPPARVMMAMMQIVSQARKLVMVIAPNLSMIDATGVLFDPDILADFLMVLMTAI